MRTSRASVRLRGDLNGYGDAFGRVSRAPSARARAALSAGRRAARMGDRLRAQRGRRRHFPDRPCSPRSPRCRRSASPRATPSHRSVVPARRKPVSDLLRIWRANQDGYAGDTQREPRRRRRARCSFAAPRRASSWSRWPAASMRGCRRWRAGDTLGDAIERGGVGRCRTSISRRRCARHMRRRTIVAVECERRCQVRAWRTTNARPSPEPRHARSCRIFPHSIVASPPRHIATLVRSVRGSARFACSRSPAWRCGSTSARCSCCPAGSRLSRWDSTLALFENEYHVPVLSPQVAAVMATIGELGFSTLLIAGSAAAPRRSACLR